MTITVFAPVLFQAVVLPLLPPPPAPVFAEGSRGIQLEYRFGQRFPVADQQFSSFQPAGNIVSVPLAAVWAVTSELFAKPFPAAEQRFNDFQAFGNFGYEPGPDGWWGIQLDYRFATPFPASEQQFWANQLIGNVPPPPSSTLGFSGFLHADPEVFGRPFPVTYQRFGDFMPLGNVPSAKSPHGWEGIQLEYRFASPFPATLQQFYLWNTPQNFTPPVPLPEGWRPISLDWAFKNPFAASAQQFQPWNPGSYPQPSNSRTWYTALFPELFKRPLPVVIPKFNTTDEGWLPPLPGPPGPGAGKRKDVTPYIPTLPPSAAPNEPRGFQRGRATGRPIWDRRDERGIPTPLPLPPAMPVPLPPASLFGAPAPQATIDVNKLPMFDHLAPHDPQDLTRRMQDTQDIADIMNLLRMLGMLK
jgi:hypothetical protein